MADLEIKGLSKSFGGINALLNVDFQANSGEVHALLGENGAGKSTLIKCLGACQGYDSGEIFLDGKKMTARHPKEAMNAGIGIVFQELSLIPSISVADNIFLGMNMENSLPITRKKIVMEKTELLLKKFDIYGIEPERKAGDLSLSEKQMIEIVKVVSRNTRVVVFDEATSALTANRVEWLLKLVKKLKAEGRILIFISHRMGEIRDFCDVVTVFRNGENAGTFNLSEVDNDTLITTMLGRKVTGYYPEKNCTKQEKIAIEVKKLSFENYLEDVSFRLNYGEVVGLGGLAGQGQKPLLLALSGCVNVQRGEIYLDGERVHFNNPQQAMSKGIILVPEERATEGLVLEMSISDNLILSCLPKISKLGFIDEKKKKMVLKHAINSFSIKVGDLHNPVRSLSGGNQQKVVLAKLMALEPRVLLLYDFTRGVDVGTKNVMFKLVRDLAAVGNSVLFYSTDIEELVNVCDRVLVMDGGKIRADITGPELTQENILRAAVGEQIQ